MTRRRERDDDVGAGGSYDEARGCNEGGMVNEGGGRRECTMTKEEEEERERDIKRGRSCHRSLINRKLFA